jgi:hypothetical protein
LLPADRRGAVVAVATNDGVKAAIVARVGDDWQVQGWVEKPWEGSFTYGATVLFTFP